MGSLAGAEASAAAKTGRTVGEWRALRAAGLLWCYSCRRWLGGEIFTIDQSRGTGKASLCRPCNSRRSTRSRYGLTQEEEQTLRDQAVDGCPICKRTGQTMVIDHDHKTGAVRSYLCSRCNVGLGLFADDPELLGRAISYLKDHDDG